MNTRKLTYHAPLKATVEGLKRPAGIAKFSQSLCTAQRNVCAFKSLVELRLVLGFSDCEFSRSVCPYCIYVHADEQSLQPNAYSLVLPDGASFESMAFPFRVVLCAEHPVSLPKLSFAFVIHAAFLQHVLLSDWLL